MSPFRFSLATLLLAVAAGALVSASLSFAGAGWMVAVGSSAVTLLAAATLIGVLHPRRSQGFWVGMALWGWLYLAIVFGPWADRLAPNLATTVLLNYASTHMPRSEDPQIDNSWNVPKSPPPAIGSGAFPFAAPSPVSGATTSTAGGYNSMFVTTGEFWCALLLGVIGGWLARSIEGRRCASAV